jgi:hypothetical protein
MNHFITKNQNAMESNSPLDSDIRGELYISGQSSSFLKETAGWAKFLAILGFIFIGFMVIVGLSAGVFMSAFSSAAGEDMPFPPAFLSILYLAMAAFYFFPVLYLFRFSTYMQRALKTTDQNSLDEAFSNIKSHYKFVGILSIVILGFYVLALVILMFTGMAGLFMMI